MSLISRIGKRTEAVFYGVACQITRNLSYYEKALKLHTDVVAEILSDTADRTANKVLKTHYSIMTKVDLRGAYEEDEVSYMKEQLKPVIEAITKRCRDKGVEPEWFPNDKRRELIVVFNKPKEFRPS